MSVSVALGEFQTGKDHAMPNKPKLALNTTSPEISQRIAHRAYEFYEARGREHGHDMEDWLSAEAEIIGGATMPDLSEKAAS